ncbi:hypothetical protein Q4599_09665 [Cellulophaga lytica]|uniref:hypothetical protein n=1 Tax=Cellulophaga lytica TaxID=979 RepID=UPI0026E32CC3|nr:hypothetical protein [Cellulophaga lytica]MDO6853846.1 hypothetical protein [Cellulophaga lytica]
MRERTLLDANRKKVVGLDGTGRRVDFVVLDNAGNTKYVVEVTSETANKTAQEPKETFIRNNGGDFIKIPGKNGALVDISDVPTRTIRLP